MVELQRILYVEDDLDIQAVAELALEEVGGYTLRVCSSGQEALDAAAEFQPHLLLLDVMMPDMDGMQTLAALRKMAATSATPVVFMTARASRKDIDQYMALGALGVIPKPFEPLEMPEQLRSMWRQSQDAA